MTGPEHRLDRLLASLRPALDPIDYAFVRLDPGTTVPADVEPLALFREDEGTTLVVTADAARAHGWDNHFRCRRITLRVHSALEAVGMLAEVARWLADAGIPANTLSAVHHDHLFVPADRAAEALDVIERGSREWNRG